MSTELQYRDLLPQEVFFETIILPDGYMVSNYGRVLSKSREIMRSNNVPKKVAAKILSTQVNQNGYACVTIREPSKPKRTFRVHRLVAMAFIPNDKPASSLINHKDGNKLNNHVSNLEWCDHSANLDHAYQTGLRTANTLPALEKRKSNRSNGKSK